MTASSDAVLPPLGDPHPLARLRGRLASAPGRTGDAAVRLVHRIDRRRDAGRSVRWPEVADALLVDPPPLVTVDVFDTVLTRALVGSPSVELAVGEAQRRAGAWGGSARSYAAARRRAAHANPGAALGAVYRDPALAPPAGPAARPGIEVATEAELSRPVPGAVAALERLRAAGVQVRFVSDMHLARSDVWRLLEGRGLAAGGDEVVVSCEVGARKSAGDLFPHLALDRRAVHIGNDLWADVAMAERAGLRSVPMRAAEPNHLEVLMAGRPGTAGPAIASAARQARLRRSVEDPEGEHLALLGAGVAGQFFTAFLLWVRDRCEAEGVRDVAFLARDGDLPLRMARAMPADHWAGTTLRYLHCSRRAWTVAAADVVGVDEWVRMGTVDRGGFLLQGRERVPMASLLQRLALVPEDLPSTSWVRELDPTQPLPADRLTAWEELLDDPAVRDLVAERAAGSRALIVDHLADEGITDQRMALVDVGWRGQLAWALSALLRDVTGHEPVHLHVGGSNVAPGVDEQVDIRRFAMDDRVAPPPVDRPVSCIEAFTGSGAARAVGFERRDDGGVALVFEQPVPEAGGPARAALWAAAVETSRQLPSRTELERWVVDHRTLDHEARAVLAAFWNRPSRADARALSALGFEADDAGRVVDRLAARYRLRDLVAPGGRPTRQWEQGSVRLTPAPVSLAVRAWFALRRVRARRR